MTEERVKEIARIFADRIIDLEEVDGLLVLTEFFGITDDELVELGILDKLEIE